MNHVSIPEWTGDGVLPPIDVRDPTSANRSPYRISLTDFVLRFGKSPARCEIINGFLAYRKALHNVGMTDGFQWLDGSFLEDVETVGTRDPKDIDVVTFFSLSAGTRQKDIVDQDPDLFLPASTKATYNVDGYTVDLKLPPEKLVARSHYWYSVWSHRRDMAWKGYIEIDLAPSNDEAATALLETCPGL
jgi:hypothetical protein